MAAHEQDVQVLAWSLVTSRTCWEGFTPAALPARPTADAEQHHTAFRVEARLVPRRSDSEPARRQGPEHRDRGRRLDAAAAQVRRFLSLDVDARGWPDVAFRGGVPPTGVRR